MKISLKNKIIRIGFFISKEPNIKNLEKELADFFSKNEIGGYEIKQFRIEGTVAFDYRIVPLEPPLEECLSGEGIHTKEIEEIGKKYGIKHLGFIYWCYHK